MQPAQLNARPIPERKNAIKNPARVAKARNQSCKNNPQSVQKPTPSIKQRSCEAKSKEESSPPEYEIPKHTPRMRGKNLMSGFAV
jgi:hypothetical protein